jgi:hypothetical protein
VRSISSIPQSSSGEKSSGSSSDDDDAGAAGSAGVVASRNPRGVGAVGRPAATMVLPGGKIKCFASEDGETFYAVAECTAHGKDCHKQRTLLRPKQFSYALRAKGRPFGYLAAWLNAGLDPAVATSAKHKWGLDLSRGKRKLGRSEVQDADGYEDGLERSPRSSESDGEPIHEP